MYYTEAEKIRYRRAAHFYCDHNLLLPPTEFLDGTQKQIEDIELAWEELLRDMCDAVAKTHRIRFGPMLESFASLMHMQEEWFLDSILILIEDMRSRVKLQSEYQQLSEWLEQSSYPSLENLPADC